MPVELRCLSLDDIPVIARLLGQGPEIADWTARIPFPYTKEDARTFVANVLSSGERVYAITADGSPELLGAAGILPSEDGVEIGYWLGQPYWGKGLATQAVRVLLDRLRADGIAPVYAHVFPDNAASIRVLEKCGFVYADEGMHDLPLRGGMRLVQRYRLSPTTPS